MKWTATVLPLAGVTAAAATILGVPPEKQSLYKPNGDGNWACLNHPEIVIPFDQVNDDYCDCPDGSDEPGTAACVGNQFYCANKGHIAGYIPSSRVNDGVCDYDLCCDGSDEAGNEFVKCPNKCKEIHAKFAAEKKEKAAKLAAGLAAKQRLIDKAAGLRDEVQKKIVHEENRIVKLQEQLSRDQMDLGLAMEEERKFKLANGANEEQLDVPDEIKQAVDKLRVISDQRKQSVDRVQRLKSQYDELKDIVDRMKTGYNPNFNDAAVKEALREFDALKEREEQIGEISSVNSEMDAIIADLEKYRPSGSDSDSSILPPFAQKYLGELRTWAEQNGLVAVRKRKGTSTESEKVRVIRNKVIKNEQSIKEIQADVNSMLADLNKDYGQDDVLRALKDVCTKEKIGEYDYELCFFAGASQNGLGHNSNLGTYEKLTFGEDGTVVMEYENGTRCWNGPVRRAVVHIQCGGENKMLTVSEPEKCEYHFKMLSPIACVGTPEEIAHEDL